MCQVEPTAPGHQELAARRSHPIVYGDSYSGPPEHLSGHQPGGAGADDDHLARALGHGAESRFDAGVFT